MAVTDGEAADSPTRQSDDLTSGDTKRLSSSQRGPAPEPPPPRFRRETLAEGRTLAGRYQIIRFIAKGGMGEVYEAEDTILKHRLALKTIRAELSEEPQVLDRFKREILLARRVSHPNICRIYDLGSHHATPEEIAAGASPDLMFLTMELLKGESLYDRLERVGHLKESEALPILEQIAAGLDAAHAAGVIHRDLKSANIMLLPPREAGKPERVVITDFGLARHTAGESLTTLSELGAVMGTPAYMAPEQVQGKKLGPPADIYALGIILYEMVVGSRPFDGETPVATAARRLTEDAMPPVHLRPDLDPRWNAAILRCLQRDPEARFATAGDIVKALRGETPIVVSPSVQPRKAVLRTRRSLFVVPILAIAAALAVWLIWRGRAAGPTKPQTEAARTAPVTIRRSAAIVGLRNASQKPDLQWMGTAVSEFLAQELGAGNEIRVIPAESVVRAARDVGADAGVLTADSRTKLRSALGADFLVAGSYESVPGSGLIRLDLRAEDAASGKALASASATGTQEQLSDITSRAAIALRQQLGLPPLSPSQVVEAGASLPSNPEAARLYVEGIAKLRAFDAAGARDALQKSLASDAKHPLPHAALADAWAALGYETRARDEAKQAVVLAAKLPKEGRLAIEARYAELTKDWPKAIDSYDSLFRAFPDSVDYGLHLADAQTRGGKTKEALVTVESLHKLPSASSDPRIDLAEARTWQEQGDFKKQQALASRAADKAKKAGLGLLLARARLLEATALQSLGDSKGAGAAIEEARGLYEAAGDRENVGRALELMVATIYSEDLAGGRKLLDRAFDIYKRLGDQSSMARVQSNIGILLVNQGRIAEAQRVFDESLATFRQIGAKYEAAAALNQLGVLLLNRGELTAALKRYREALTIFSELGEKSGTALTLSNIGEVLANRGDLDQARKMNEEALATNREIGDKGGAAYDLYLLGGVFQSRGDLVASRDRYQEALTIQNQIGDKAGAADTRAALAQLSRLQGRAAEGETGAREAEEILRTEGAFDRAALAQAVLSESLLEQGKIAAARESANSAAGVAAKSEDRRVRLAVSIVDARVRASSGKAEEVASALKTLQAVASEAGTAQIVPYEFEARLAMGQVEMAAGKSAAGRVVLMALAKDAKKRGFGLVERRALSALENKGPKATS